MATAGDAFSNPSGGRLVFRRTKSDTDGELIEVEVTYEPHSDLPPAHYHPGQEETFTVLKGALTTYIDGVERVYQAGETFVVPAGTHHRMHNAGAEESLMRWQVRPALNTEAFFETMWTMAAMRKDGLLQTAAVLQAHKEEIRLSSPVLRVIIMVLAPLGELLARQPARQAS